MPGFVSASVVECTFTLSEITYATINTSANLLAQNSREVFI